MKLTKAQVEVMERLESGWIIAYSTWNGDGEVWYARNSDLVAGDKIRIATFVALRDKGLIRQARVCDSRQSEWIAV